MDNFMNLPRNLVAAACLAMSLAVIPANAKTARPAAEWVTLGTSGGPAVQPSRAQIANALLVNGSVYLFDLGNGVRRQMALAGIPEGGVKAIFLSHHHLDHNADLGPVMIGHHTFYQGVLPVIGPQGTKHLVAGLAAANEPTILAGYPTAGLARPPLADYFKPVDLPTALQVPTLVFEDTNVKVWAIGVDHFQQPPSIPLDHMPDAVAYRIEAGGRTFVFTGDSGPSKRLELLAKGADVLITEVVETDAIAANIRKTVTNSSPALLEAIIAGMKINHLVPAEIGRMASAAGVKQIVLTHFVPSPEVSDDPKSFTRDISRTFRGKVAMAKDLQRF